MKLLFLFWMDCIYGHIHKNRNISLWCILNSCVCPYPIPERWDTGIAWWVANGTSLTRPKTYYSDHYTVSERQRTTTVSLKHCYQKYWFLNILEVLYVDTDSFKLICGMHSRAVTRKLKIMLLSGKFLHEMMSITGVALQVRIWRVQLYCFTVNV